MILRITKKGQKSGLKQSRFHDNKCTQNHDLGWYQKDLTEKYKKVVEISSKNLEIVNSLSTSPSIMVMSQGPSDCSFEDSTKIELKELRKLAKIILVTFPSFLREFFSNQRGWIQPQMLSTVKRVFTVFKSSSSYFARMNRYPRF